MKRIVGVAVTVLIASAPAHAQSWEVSILAGPVSSAAIERRAPELRQLDLSGGLLMGVQAAHFFAAHWGAEVLWTQQPSDLEVGTVSGKAALFASTISQLHGHFVYRFAGRSSTFEPFLFAGLGTTFFSAANLVSETKLSPDVGGGVKYFPSPWFGIRGHVRYKPTLLNDLQAGDFCDPFGFCQKRLQQVEFAGAVVMRF